MGQRPRLAKHIIVHSLREKWAVRGVLACSFLSLGLHDVRSERREATMAEPAGTAKWSDVVLVIVRFGSLAMLPIAGLSIFHGLLPHWGGGTFFMVGLSTGLLCLSWCMSVSDCEDSRPGVEVDPSVLRGEVEDLRQDVATLRSRLDAAGF